MSYEQLKKQKPKAVVVVFCFPPGSLFNYFQLCANVGTNLTVGTYFGFGKKFPLVFFRALSRTMFHFRTSMKNSIAGRWHAFTMREAEYSRLVFYIFLER